jgi:hypothetical protein
MRPSALAAVLTTLGCLLAAPPALAQDVAASEAQFERGLAAMKAGDYATGCPAIEESYRLDPRPGTMFTLAECENRRGRTATAATRYEDYLSFHARLPADQQARQGERPRVAATQRDALRARAPRLTIVVPEGAPVDATVTRDGVVLEAPSWNVALPVDPGEHVVRLEAPGRAPTEARITIGDGEALSVPLALGAVAPAADRPPPPAASRPPQASPAADRGLTGVQTGGLILGGVGVAALGAGSVFGLLTLGEKSTIDRACPASPGGGARLCSTREGKDAADSAATTGAISTVAFGVGAAALAGGILMLVLGDDDGAAAAADVRPVLSADATGGFAGARGRF